MGKIQGQKDWKTRKSRIIIGVILIIGSIAYGWIGLVSCNMMALRYGPRWSLAGVVIYAISWVTYGLGFILAGTAGTVYARKFFKRIFKWKR